MPYRIDAFHSGGLYHIYNRGAGKADIFRGKEDYEIFLNLLANYCVASRIGVVCYCLMRNHYHLLLHQESATTVSRLMQPFTRAYAQRFNSSRGGSGTIFEGRFRHKAVETDAYLIQLMPYIHANPVRAGFAERPELWPHSDLQVWTAPNEKALTAQGSNPLWKFDRAEKFRGSFGIPDAASYEAEVAHYTRVRLEEDQFMKALYQKKSTR